ncbi:MAG: RecQ family ATP-dependent DNA helicase [Verrucomicrobiales bacterium]|nr:RecQ family ATP-dependent DNA helicase [Verrucomicrobiales bacterium]
MKALRPGQKEVIDILLEGRSALAVFPTGGGKSLCYQLPAMMLDGVTLVVSPLIALMKDQVDFLKGRGIGAARLDSSVSTRDQEDIWKGLQAGHLKLLYVAPERLANVNFRQRVQALKISLLAVDEAHCISEWGHNFRPDYLKLADFAFELQVGRVLALTATATPEVSDDICSGFGINQQDHVQLSFRRDNLTFRVIPCTGAERDNMLVERVRSGNGVAVVYVTLQFTAERVATLLAANGVNAKAYHAGLRDDYRAQVQEQFMCGEIDVVVATIAFGMGIDKADIRRIYHYNLPKSLENYVQETGRAGRDGKQSYCELLACLDDRIVLENFIYGDTPTRNAVRSLLDCLLRQGRDFDVSRYELSSVYDIRPMVVATIMTRLEMKKIIMAVAPFYNVYRLEFLREEDALLSGYDREHRSLLERIFAAGKRGRRWMTLATSEIAGEIGEDAKRVRRAIRDLEDAGDILVKPSGLRGEYRLLDANVDIGQLAREFRDLFAQREQKDIQRLNRVVDFAANEGCRVGWILDYFGESPGKHCGQCDVCSGTNTTGGLPGGLPEEMTQDEIQAVHELVAERHAALGTPRQLTRFLCGLRSPASSRARLTRHDVFGLLEHVPFADVLVFTESLNLG